METRTINGLSKKEIIKLIEANFPEKLIKHDDGGHPYFPATAYQARMNEVVGIFNYDYIVSPHKIIEVKEALYVTAIGTLTIKYDDGTPALVREAEGGARVILLKSSGQPKELTDNIKSAGTDAFKACCRKLGMAEAQLLGYKDNSRNTTNNNAEKPERIQEKDYKVVITGRFESLKNGGYKASAKDVATNDVVSIVLWSDVVKKIEERMPMSKFCEIYVNKALTIVAQKSTFNSRSGPETTLTVRGFSQTEKKPA